MNKIEYSREEPKVSNIDSDIDKVAAVSKSPPTFSLDLISLKLETIIPSRLSDDLDTLDF